MVPSDKWKCTQCSASFFTNLTRIRHLYSHIGDKPTWVCQSCATTKDDEYKHEFDKEKHACFKKKRNFMLEPKYFDMRELHRWAEAHQISKFVLEEQLQLFQKLSGTQSTKTKSPAKVKSIDAGPSKTRKLTPLFEKFPICDKTKECTTVSSTGTKRTIMIRNKSVPVNYVVDTPEVIKLKGAKPLVQTDQVAKQSKAKSTPVVKGTGKAGRGLKVKNSHKVKPSPIRPPEMSNKLSVKTDSADKPTVLPVKTKKIAISGPSTVDVVIENVARGGIPSDSSNHENATKTPVTSDFDIASITELNRDEWDLMENPSH